MADQPPDQLSKTARQLRAAQPYLDAVWRFTGSTAGGVLLGYFLDRWLGTKPWFLLGLSLLGIAVGFYTFLKTLL